MLFPDFIIPDKHHSGKQYRKTDWGNQANRFFIRAKDSLFSFSDKLLVCSDIYAHKTFDCHVEIMLFPERGQLRHHGRCVMRVNGGLIRPAVDEQDGFRIIQRPEILITQIAGFFPNVFRDAGGFHFLRKGSGISVCAFIVQINRNHLLLLPAFAL
jgi:hypothetical protein